MHQLKQLLIIRIKINLVIYFFNIIFRPYTRQNSQTREHIIPIRFESEDKTKAKPVQRTSSIASSTKTSGSNLSRQSTMESDSNSSIVSMGGEPIRKSPREVIIPIAVEGGGFVTPSENAISRIRLIYINIHVNWE